MQDTWRAIAAATIGRGRAEIAANP
jgi:hypothetical protein